MSIIIEMFRNLGVGLMAIWAVTTAIGVLALGMLGVVWLILASVNLILDSAGAVL